MGWWTLAVAVAAPDVTWTSPDGVEVVCLDEPREEVLGAIDGGDVVLRACETARLPDHPVVYVELEWRGPEGPTRSVVVDQDIGPWIPRLGARVQGRSVLLSELDPGSRYAEPQPSCQDWVLAPDGRSFAPKAARCLHTGFAPTALWMEWALALGQPRVAARFAIEDGTAASWESQSTIAAHAMWLPDARDRAVARLRAGDREGAALVAYAALRGAPVVYDPSNGDESDVIEGCWLQFDGVPVCGDVVAAVNDLAWVMEQGGLPDPARRALERVVAVSPDRAVAWLNLGDAAWGAGDTVAAAVAWDRYEALTGDLPRAASAVRDRRRRVGPGGAAPVDASPERRARARQLGDFEVAYALEALAGWPADDEAARLARGLDEARLRLPKLDHGALVAPPDVRTALTWPPPPASGPERCDVVSRWVSPPLPCPDGRTVPLVVRDVLLDGDLVLDRVAHADLGGVHVFATWTGGPGFQAGPTLVVEAEHVDWDVVYSGSFGAVSREVAVRWLDADGVPHLETVALR
jgi:hypothetical protein